MNMRHIGYNNWMIGVTVRTAACLIVLVLLFFPTHGTCAQASSNVDVVKVVYFKLNHSVLDALSSTIMHGFNASLYSSKSTPTKGVRVEIVTKETTFQEHPSAVSEALKNDSSIYAVVGHCGDRYLERIKDVLSENNAVSFAPFTGSSTVRGWNPHLYFVRVDPAAELLALLRYAVTRLRVRRLGFMYLQGVSFGDSEYEQAVRVMREMGYELSGVFTVKSSLTGEADEREFDAAWEAFAETVPQAVIVFGSPIRDTAKFLRRVLTDNRTAGAYLLAPSALDIVIIGTWRAVLSAGGVGFVPGQVIMSGTNPLAKDTSYEAIKRFQTVMRDYLKNSGQTQYTDTDHFLNDDKDGEMMVAGWIAGEVLLQAINNPVSLKGRKAFMESLFDQRRYLIDDIVIGDYGGDCKGDAASQGAACRCNQGGHTVYMKRFLDDRHAEVLREGMLSLNALDCTQSRASLRAPLSMLFMDMTKSKVKRTAERESFLGAAGSTPLYNVIGSSGVTFTTLKTSSARFSSNLNAEINERRVHGIAGVATEAMLDVDDVTFVDPLFLEPRLTRFRRHVIHLQPTLEQQFFVHAEYLRSSAGSEVSAHAVIRSDEAGAVADVLRRSLVTFGGSLRSATLLGGGDELVRHLPREGDVFVVGVAAADVAAIAGHLAQHGGVRVFVAFSEFALLHADFVAAFSGSAAAAADRLVFATSLPHWNDVRNNVSETAQQFIAAVPNATQRTPLSLMGFATTVLLRTVRFRMDKVSAELLADFFYNNVAVTAYDMLYGPFADGVACAPAAVAKGCGVNYGASHISVWSLARALDPAVPVLFPATTPSMVYVEPTQDGLTKGQLAGVIVGCVLVIALVIILVVVFLFCCRDSRDNVNAPKEPTDPVTLVFTDIESSTALWAACPREMTKAVETHHRLIRALIAKYRCYEVKTIGDSFMIACKSPFAAVQLAGELQQVFLNYDWGTSAIDDAYRLLEEGRAAEDDEYVPPTARLDAAVYEQYWRGLRVRVGMHTGLADIRHDEVTKGYDYYGGTSNTAARTESVANGGQVVLTRATYLALSTAEREQVSVTALGAVPLRGVPRPVELYQLDAVPGRTFAALRLDREMGDLDDMGANESASEFSCCTRDSHCESYAAMINGLLSPLEPRHRADFLKSLCMKWRICSVERGKLSIEGYCGVLVDRLAGRVSRVVAPKVVPFAASISSFTSCANSSLISVRVPMKAPIGETIVRPVPSWVTAAQSRVRSAGTAAQPLRELPARSVVVVPSGVVERRLWAQASEVSSERDACNSDSATVCST